MSRWLLTGAVIGLLLWAGPARALMTTTQITPANVIDLPYVITVTTRPVPQDQGVAEATNYVVTIKPKKGNLSGCRVATLLLHDGAAQVAACPIAECPYEYVLTYKFQVAAKLAAQSKFDFAEIAASPVTNTEGKIRYIGFPGNNHYWFYLKDVPRLEAVTSAKAKPD